MCTFSPGDMRIFIYFFCGVAIDRICSNTWGIERRVTNLIQCKWEVTWTLGTQVLLKWGSRRVNRHSPPFFSEFGLVQKVSLDLTGSSDEQADCITVSREGGRQISKQLSEIEGRIYVITFPISQTKFKPRELIFNTDEKIPVFGWSHSCFI